MVTKTGQATVEIENRLIPIAYDGDNSSVPIAERTVEAALNGFEWKPGYVGFKFAEAAKAKITVEETGEEITFTRETTKGKRYIFANKIVSLEEFNESAKYKTRDADYLRSMLKDTLAKPETVIYESDRGLKILDQYDRKDTVLVNRQGEQLFPLKKATP